MLKTQDREIFLNKAIKLIELHQTGKLGGEIMPEDKNPGYSLGSKENYLYFTLPMALNYQRNAYKLWESAYETASDSLVADVFDPQKVIAMTEEKLREKLVKHKVALQMNKQTAIWQRLCQTFTKDFNGDVRELFKRTNYSVTEIKTYMLAHKKDFPYLSGNKIMNYWLYVMTQYTDLKLVDRENISVAPDTNVIQASLKLAIITEEEYNSSQVQQIVAECWQEIFSESQYEAIDIHTPLWLWTRSKFAYFEEL
ncbi:hypothetical protein M2139_002007 [Enterococcus sp. PF1-24]|uniref:hypothetical protein n=1 Tax=unclassified Enterococcus TaxID=2608891 RepID=UPI0024733EEF|nr:MULTISPECIES: hypothetical protein [unclassified Enterococcus]MDH6365006.1 hypothetical protein [Enterococcus sp. PFB1-1]MDH6402107.1 hypothetical protein [Enterococcus sp. PF1-24]